MIKLLMLFLLLILPLMGQGSPVLYQRLFNNLAVVPSYSGPIIQVGNRAHQIYVLMLNHAPNVCNSPQTVDIGFDASFDNIVWTPTGPQIVAIATDSSGYVATLVTGLGAFPYIRLAARNFNTANCLVTAYYSGTIGPFPALQLSSTGGSGGSGGGSGGFPTPSTFIYINNLTTGNTTTYTVYGAPGSDTRQITLKGPAGSVATETGTFNGNPYANVLGITDVNGNFNADMTYTAPDTGNYNTIIRVGTGQIGITRQYTVQ